MPDIPPDQLAQAIANSAKPGWTSEDIGREIASQMLLGTDWAQTRTIAKNPYDSGRQTTPWHETNPILGAHPSSGKVNNYFAASMLGHALLMNALPPEARKWAQYGTIGLEGGVTGKNKFNLGIGMTF